MNSRNADLEASIDTLSREADSIVAEVDGAVGKMDEVGPRRCQEVPGDPATRDVDTPSSQVTTAAEEATKTLQDSG